MKDRLMSLSRIASKDWKQLKDYVNAEQDCFINKLLVLHPQLTEDDIHIILLWRIGMSNREIAHCQAILTDSFRKRRYRLKQKMNLKCDSISDTIKSLVL